MPAEISYLALGDSYTCGTSVAEAESWPVLLAAALTARLTVVARSGWRTDNLANALAEKPRGRYDLVSLQIGVNDQYQGFHVSGFAERLSALVQRSIDYAGGEAGRLLVVSIPDYACTPSGGGDKLVSEQIDIFNTAARKVAQRYGVSFYDITAISRQGIKQPQLVAEDGLHPSGVQYKAWVDEILLAGVRAELGGR